MLDIDQNGVNEWLDEEIVKAVVKEKEEEEENGTYVNPDGIDLPVDDTSAIECRAQVKQAVSNKRKFIEWSRKLNRMEESFHFELFCCYNLLLCNFQNE